MVYNPATLRCIHTHNLGFLPQIIYCKTLIFGSRFILALLAVKVKTAKIEKNANNITERKSDRLIEILFLKHVSGICIRHIDHNRKSVIAQPTGVHYNHCVSLSVCLLAVSENAHNS